MLVKPAVLRPEPSITRPGGNRVRDGSLAMWCWCERRKTVSNDFRDEESADRYEGFLVVASSRGDTLSLFEPKG